MLNVRFFRNPRFTAASLTVTLVFFALVGFIFLATQYLQFVLGYTPFEAGVRTLPFAFAMMATAPLVVEARRVGGHQARRCHRDARVRRGHGGGVDVDRRQRLPARRDRDGAARQRHGPRAGAVDRVDHGLAPTFRGGRRLGGQRHQARGRRRARRGRDRQHAVVDVRQPVRRAHARRAAGDGTRRGRRLARRRAPGQRPARQCRRGRRRCGTRGVRVRDVTRVAGDRRDRGARRVRGVALPPGARRGRGGCGRARPRARGGSSAGAGAGAGRRSR